MSHDVIVGSDGRPRCAWAGDAATPLGRYHDDVWGQRTYDQHAMFEALTLGVFQVGLSWSTVFNKRDAFRTAFHGFDIAKVAAMADKDVDRLTQDASIIRNRARISPIRPYNSPDPLGDGEEATWAPSSSTLISGPTEGIMIDALC